MAGLLKAFNVIQPAYVSPHRKRRNPVLCRVYSREYRLDILGLKCVDGNTKRRPLRMIRRCTEYTKHLRSMSFASREDWLPSLNLENSFPQLSLTLKALPTGPLGISSAPFYSTGSMESTVPDTTHTLLNFLLEAYSSFHEQALVTTIILVAIIVVATFVARSGDESHLKRVDKSLVFVSRPSQFNRFISMRCPSMSMNLSAKINVLERADIEYQRMCLHAPDGGIVAIDWPAELDFVAEEDHLANTLLLVPGTTEGSEDEGVKQFVIEAMRYGYFPVILNPRGCASSPVTTPRVFSGADSDDVRLAVQHIVRGRPGSSVMGVGWGRGANMLTKYLGEEAGSTSLMAAVAISNPFDLQQSSMFLGMTNAGQLDRVMAKGLVNILKENKVLFAGQSKGFDLKVALASTSVRDFDASISRVTHGFDTLDEFYSAASSARYIGSVQVPLLSVQGEDFSMPVTSIPYSILDENPYTAAVVAQMPASDTFSATGVVREPGSASRHRWSHTIAFEWLAAVEVALLKGHHPLLNPVSSYEKVSIESKAMGQPSLPMGLSIEDNDSRKGSKMDVSVDASNDEKIFKDEDEDGSMQGERLSVVAVTDELGGNEEVNETGAAEIKKRQDSNSEAETIPSITKGTPEEAENVSSKTESAPQEAERVSSKTESAPQEAESVSSKTESSPREVASVSSKPESTSQVAESTPSEAKSTSLEEESTSSEPSPPPVEGEPEETAEIIQMRAAAESVMNVLDVTMPGTLSEEKKTQVLTAVGEGETILTALQEAVPEDVRGNMATAVSGAVQARGLSFNLIGFGKSMPPPTLPAGLIESIKGKIAGGKKESTPTTPHLPVDGPISEGTTDTSATEAASNEKVDDEGHANPVEHNNESQKVDNQAAVVEGDKGVESENVASDAGTENKVVKQEDKSQSVSENQSKGDSSKGSKESKSEESKDSTASKPEGGKLEESKSEGPKDSAERKSAGGKQESKPEEPKDSTASKPEGGKLEESKSEGPKDNAERKSAGGKQESKPEEPKDSTASKPEGGKLEESKSEGPKDSAERKSAGGKQESKPEEPKDSTASKPEGGKLEESKSEGPKDSAERKSAGGKQESKPEEPKDSTASKPEGGKLEESKSEGPKDSAESKQVEGKHEGPKSEDSKSSTEGKPLGGKHEELKTDEPKESSESKPVGGTHGEPKSDESKENTGSKPMGGKQEESADKLEGAGQTEDKKDGAQDAPVDEVARKDDKKLEDFGESNISVNAKEETKPAEENQPSPDTPVPAASAPPSPVLENSTSPALSAPNTGMTPPLDMKLAFQALTGFDDSTQMAVTNVFGVVEGLLEKLEQEQVAASPDASANDKDASNDRENRNGKGNDKKNDDKKVVYDSRPQYNDEDGAIETGVARIGLNNADHGDDSSTQETATTKKRETVEVTDKKQEEKKKGTKKASSVPEEPKPVKETSVNISPSNQGSGTRPQSKVMMIQRVGSCTLVEPMLEDQPLKRHSSPSVNGAFSKNNGAAVTQDGTETQQSRRPVKEGNSVTPVISERTIEQLSQEVDQESKNEGDDSSTKFNEIRADQTIEAEVTGIEETETSSMIENIVKDALKLEVLRRLGAAGMESLGIDLEQEVSKVSVSVAEAVQRWKKDPDTGSSAGKLGILSSNSVISTLGSVMGSTHILGGLVPVGVLAGVILASLGAVYLIVTDNRQDDEENDKVADEDGGMAGEEEEEEEKEEDESVSDSDSDHSSWQKVKASAVDVPVLSVDRHGETPLSASSELGEDPWLEPAEAAEDDIAHEYGDKSGSEGLSDNEEDEREGNKQGKIMGMMAAAAVTGGAALAGMNTANKDDADEGQGRQNTGKDLGKGENIISNLHPLAEKVLTVAAPVVPTNEDGEIDQERLVAMLAELGQRGGFFRLIGKVALLWGGLRGAMSLTDRLLVFLQMNKRPLHMRLVGFSAMVVLLWSPVLVPVLPSLLHQWALKTPGGVADAASAVGLYGAILILVTIWGKRVRGYNKPLLYYGLRLWSKRKVQDLGLGLALGGVLVSFLYITNFILGYVQFSWGMLLATNPRIPGTLGVALFSAAKVCKLVGQSLALGLAVALVEEVLFRAWLQEEIAVDLGFHRAVFISALAFALVHWSPAAMPGLWFLSVSLAGARAKMNRNLAFPIGLHAGLVAVNHVMTAGGLVHYSPHAPTWFTGAHVRNPLAGALGTGLMALLAVTLYPRTTTQPLPTSKEVEHAV